MKHLQTFQILNILLTLINFERTSIKYIFKCESEIHSTIKLSRAKSVAFLFIIDFGRHLTVFCVFSIGD